MSRLVSRYAQLVCPADAPRADWLAARRDGITATDVVQIVGLSKFGTAIDVYLSKRLGEDEPAGEAALWGHLLEDQVAREWARRHQARIRRVGLTRSVVHPHHMATCDRMVVGLREPLEVKTRSAWAADEWSDDAGGVAVPERVAVQAQWQAHVLGVDRVHVTALLGGQSLVATVVERDQVLIDYLRAEADRVWAAVQAGQPPEVPPWQLTADALDRLHPNRGGTVDVDPDRALPLIEQYEAARDLEGYVKAAKEAAKVQLLALLGDSEEARVDGRTAFSWRAGEETTAIPAEKQRALLADHPDLAADYAVTRPGRRTFALASTKEKTR